MLKKNLLPHYSDEKLFSLIQNDNARAFDEIYRRYFSLLLANVCRKIDNSHLAEDIVQEVFTSLYKNRQQVNLQVSLRSYLIQAVKYKVYNEYRSNTVRSTYRQAFFYSNCKTDFANSLETAELRKKIDTVYMQLPLKCRQVFSMSRNERLTMKDISGQLQISVSTVEKHISKALSIFRANLQEYSYPS
ncbi:MAG: hypothetical protein JWP81_4889 [Ferruginibacter sp.]|nr:hypothetical protein [Ferruginibacter sp.]